MKALLLLALFGSIAMAQRAQPVQTMQNENPIAITGGTLGWQPVNKALKCEKYQHIEHWPSQCGPSSCDPQAMVCNSMCTAPPPDHCVEDVHEVTEREWQMLIDNTKAIRKALEALEKLHDIDQKEIDAIIKALGGKAKP